jgi:hypothetical protein
MNNVFNFKIIDINLDGYFLKDINIIISCPERFGDAFFKKGFTYKIEFYEDCRDMNEDLGVCVFDIPKQKRMNLRFWMHSIVKINNLDSIKCAVNKQLSR